jgi:hypothetical protein
MWSGTRFLQSSPESSRSKRSGACLDATPSGVSAIAWVGVPWYALISPVVLVDVAVHRVGAWFRFYFTVFSLYVATNDAQWEDNFGSMFGVLI